MIPHEACTLGVSPAEGAGAGWQGRPHQDPGAHGRWVASEALSASGSLGACSGTHRIEMGRSQSPAGKTSCKTQAARPSPPHPSPLYSHLCIPRLAEGDLGLNWHIFMWGHTRVGGSGGELNQHDCIFPEDERACEAAHPQERLRATQDKAVSAGAAGAKDRRYQPMCSTRPAAFTWEPRARAAPPWAPGFKKEAGLAESTSSLLKQQP